MTEFSPIIRFRLDREIARRAHPMARAQGMELPDVLRMMLVKAVRDRSFSISDYAESGVRDSASAMWLVTASQVA